VVALDERHPTARRFHLNEVRPCVKDSRVAGADEVEAFNRAFLRGIGVGIGRIRAMGVEFVYRWNLKKLKEVAIDDQLNFFVVPITFSANGFQKLGEGIVGDEVFEGVLGDVWRARPQVEIAYHDLEFA
jgi:hypothetical protein